ncbi:MAG: glycosyltransferase [Reichenbachiella sp.]|uniref:glycosyltransferase n=1 Tax=Reichenbachiella sp. TaxID=2184521 RepID=UPI003298A246
MAGIVTLLYGCILLLLLWFWRSRKFPVLSSKENQNVFATIIIPVRNESKNIIRLIRSIHEGEKDKQGFEIIVVDDHSEDDTKAVVKLLQSEYENLNYVELSANHLGKKAGITWGARLAKGDLIVCTDGDSEVASGWLDTHKHAFASGTKLAFGPVKLFNLNGSRWIDMLNQELAALVGVGAATLQMGKPTMINGCNYSFSKDAFEEVNGFTGNEEIASGDDEFLLRKIHKTYPNQIKFLKSEKALVTSEPPKNLSEFINQRRRWASKWRFHQDGFSMIAPLFIFCIYSIWGWLLIDACSTMNPLGFFVLSAKFGIDYLFINSVSRIQNSKVSLFSFILLQIIYPFYVVFFGLASNFGKYRWRDRIHKI